MTSPRAGIEDRPYDLVVYGATGFTGRQAAATIARRAPGIRWCMAGRNPTKLEALRSELGLGQVPLEVADALDEDAIDALVARTKVFLTTAGPYTTYGNAIVAACARHGTDYVDITGETPWVRRLLDQHQDTAQQSGAKIVPFCGFDSVPSDITAWFLVKALAERGSGTRLVRTVHRSKGGFNGGTLATAWTMAESGDDRKMADRTLLNPPEARRLEPAPRRDPRDTVFVEELGGYGVPFFMAPVNSRVVRRSAALSAQYGEAYGQAFDYEERMWGGRNGLGARATTGVLGLGVLAMGSSAGRALLKPLIPKPGEGPSEEAMDGGFTRVDGLAEADDGSTLQAKLVFHGDPGNRCTVALLCECALSLVEERDGLPGGEARTGFLTPATAFGEVLLRRMREVGFELDLVDS